ncbi:MAG: YfjI family protein, partial [Ruminococcus flavefaciens]|nr:YfjI family protein [Ruminococcus flavefaciens]
FDRPKALEPFPMKSLPPLLRDYLKAVADYVQVTPEMAVLPLLSVLSLCVQGKAVIKHTGNSHTEPLNLYTITVASPGERKSGSLKEFMRPVEEFQDCYNKIHAAEIEEYKTERTFLESQKNAALKGRNADLHRAKEIAKEISELERKHELVLNVSDATPEALAMEIYRQGGKIGIIDDEGSVFDVLSGIYSNGQANINIFLKAYDGSNYTILRRTKDNIELKKPLLTMGLMVQPEHFQEAVNNRQFSGRGFIHRFLFAFPESRAGYLKMTSPDIPEPLQKRYSELIKRLLRMPEPELLPIIVCSREAELLFSDYHEHLQKEIRDGGAFENLKEWASKHFGRALRIAGILHICEHEPTEQLAGSTAVNAISIAMWAENHALSALMSGATAPIEIQNAKYIFKKLQKSNKDTLTKSELLRLCQTLRAYEFDAPLEVLEDMKCIRIEVVKNGERGKPKERIKINPLIKK